MEEYFCVNHYISTGYVDDAVARIVIKGRQAVGQFIAKNMLGMTQRNKETIGMFIEGAANDMHTMGDVLEDGTTYHTILAIKLTAKPEF